MEFNKAQKIAIQPSEGIMLVIAGAGSGKTSCLVEKTAAIIRHNISKPNQILLMTFSRKAANELKERIAQRIGEDATLITAGTFHSFCYALIKEYYANEYQQSGLTPKVLDDDQKLHILHTIIHKQIDEFFGMPVKVISHLIEKWHSLHSAQQRTLNKLGIYSKIQQIIQEYKEYKAVYGLFDFQDLMMETIRILQNDSSFRERINNRYSYILVDEFQDTSDDNFALINLTLNPHKRNLFVVGDDWQSIYGFRNAQIEYMVKIKKYFPYVRIVKLTVNYRSRKEIVALSNKFIALNRFRTKKKLVSAKGSGGIIHGFLVKSRSEEIAIVEKLLLQYSNNVAILFRNNWQGNLLQNNLRTHHTPSFLTMHASKGLEFETVIIVGICDTIIPDPSSELEEERRLLYVAITRAKEHCYLIAHAKKDGSLPRFAKELGIPFRTFT